MTNRISTLISAFGVLAALMFLIFAIREYRAGSSVLVFGLGIFVFAGAVYALIRDIRTQAKGSDPERTAGHR
ncbi:hypothetical protein J7E96_32225 [Streptomyces sp. ISL-96]|uniref:hypothetical protein n=1 Tax=Streptomyces sp. ISL-96 TaxID=2819191 RepID=UPI001BEC9E52|nr:hypothetical protein [Streptomyces sp. ISL-96]MBT2493094.1 hypothetical protein [Streptomyces sp. ISL-96]